MLQTKFEPSDADATQVNDFRRVGIVKNPEVSVGGSPFTELQLQEIQMQFYLLLEVVTIK